jgi:LacI family transcriptional regulator
VKHDRPTILDLARLTGISTSTISRAFNRSPENRINPETKEKILRKAREIGYSPHSGARAMIQGRTGRWGLLLPHLDNPRYVQIMDQLDRQAHARSGRLLLGLSRFNPAVEAELALHWGSGETDGIIADSCIDPKVFEQLRRRRFPLVFLYGRPSPRFNMVTIRAAEAFVELMRKMFQAGHRRIGFLSWQFPAARLHAAFRAYRQVLREEGLAEDPNLIFFGSEDYRAGGEAWQRWRKLKSRPTAVLCFNDVIAISLIEAAENDGCRLPGDLSVTGADDIAMAARYRLTTIQADVGEMARQVFELLEQIPSLGEKRFVKGVPIYRGSIGAIQA